MPGPKTNQVTFKVSGKTYENALKDFSIKPKSKNAKGRGFQYTYTVDRNELSRFEDKLSEAALKFDNYNLTEALVVEAIYKDLQFIMDGCVKIAKDDTKVAKKIATVRTTKAPVLVPELRNAFRMWAAEQGYTVGQRGRFNGEHVTAFLATL